MFYLDGDGGSRAGGARVHCRDSEGRDMGMPGPPPNLGSGFNLKLADSPMLPIA